MVMEKISLLAKHLTPELERSLQGLRTSNQFRIKDVTRSGVENPDSSVGVYAGDEESYTLFSPLLDKVIEDYHGHGPQSMHRRDLAVESLGAVGDLDPSGERIVSTRIRVGRNLKGFAFAPAISKEGRLQVEQKTVEALQGLSGELAGTYYPLLGMSEETKTRLIQDHFLFKEGDRFLKSAGANRDWPEARGIFHSANKQFLVWVNEEDHLRIISMQPGGNVRQVFARLSTAIGELERKLQFAYSDRLGYLSSCPSNLGTVMRASVHVKLPKLGATPEFTALCAGMGLSVRGIHGEHSDSEGGVFDISNKRRLGITEAEAVTMMADGVQKLMDMESRLV
jgi:protein-arginine kinase